MGWALYTEVRSGDKEWSVGIVAGEFGVPGLSVRLGARGNQQEYRAESPPTTRLETRMKRHSKGLNSRLLYILRF